MTHEIVMGGQLMRFNTCIPILLFFSLGTLLFCSCTSKPHKAELLPKVRSYLETCKWDVLLERKSYVHHNASISISSIAIQDVLVEGKKGKIKSVFSCEWGREHKRGDKTSWKVDVFPKPIIVDLDIEKHEGTGWTITSKPMQFELHFPDATWKFHDLS